MSFFIDSSYTSSYNSKVSKYSLLRVEGEIAQFIFFVDKEDLSVRWI